DDHAVGGDPAIVELQQARLDTLGQRRRGDVEPGLHGVRHLVDVLAAGALGANRRELDLGLAHARCPRRRAHRRLARRTSAAKAPASSPQNGAPIPASDTPDAVTRNAISAGSRSRSSASAANSALPLGPSSASPAIGRTSSRGSAANTATTAAPHRPARREDTPAATAAT